MQEEKKTDNPEMKNTMPQPDYRLTFRPKAGQVPPVIRLRRLLKLALRAFGFRCVSVQEVNPDPPKDGPVDGTKRKAGK